MGRSYYKNERRTDGKTNIEQKNRGKENVRGEGLKEAGGQRLENL